MNDKTTKLENPIRLAELNPAETLKRIGVQEGQVLCDIGAGSGIFTIPAAKITGSTVYAVEISESMLAVIADKARAEGLDNIELIHTAGDRYTIDDHSIDVALAVTVLHEISDKAAFLAEVWRLLKPGGLFAVIEFHKRETPMGPPVSRRLSKEDVSAALAGAGFRPHDAFDLGHNFYCLAFKQE
jgi:ubiquinone/menaquinone biosynthesis C-methylase UbiE